MFVKFEHVLYYLLIMNYYGVARRISHIVVGIPRYDLALCDCLFYLLLLLIISIMFRSIPVAFRQFHTKFTK